MPPKTRTSQRNKAHAEAASAPSAQFVATSGTVDASEPQVTIKANKPTTKRAHANNTTGNKAASALSAAQLVANTGTVDASEPQSTVTIKATKPTTKRAHANDTTGNDSDAEVAPAKKKTKVADAASKAAKVKPVPESCVTLPERKGRNKHPGAIAKPRMKRTTAQVEAENVAKAEMKRRLEELEEEKRRLWAQMETDEDERELERQVKAVRRLSDVIVTDREATSTESEGEDFNMDDVEASDSEDVDTDPKPVGKKKKVSCPDLSMCSKLQTE
jgi:hypothetical protein